MSFGLFGCLMAGTIGGSSVFGRVVEVWHICSVSVPWRKVKFFSTDAMVACSGEWMCVAASFLVCDCIRFEGA